MYDMDMRDYDPAIGRWVVQDPVVHFGKSPYNAFDNNPVFWADPSGADSQMPSWLQDIWNSSESGVTNWTNTGNGTFSQDEVVGGPGTEFNSEKEAAINFGLNYNGFSIIKEVEVASVIYKLKNGKCSYLTPYVTGGGLVDASINKSLISQVAAISGAVITATIHSHGSDPKAIKEMVFKGILRSESNDFTGDYKKFNSDNGDIHNYRDDMKTSPFGGPIRGYMTAPNGGLYFFDPQITYKGRKNEDGRVIYEYDNPIYESLPSDKYQGKQRLNRIEPSIKRNLKFQNY